MPAPSNVPDADSRALRHRAARRLARSLVLLVTLTWNAHAPAQTLNLGPGASLPSGERYALDRAIAGLERDARRLDASTNDRPADRLSHRYRAGAIALLKRGRELGDRGESHIIFGLTLARGAASFDELAARSATWTPEASARLSSLVSALPAIPEAVPADGPGLDRVLSQKLAPIVELERGSGPGAAMPGWVRSPPVVDVRFAPARSEPPRPASAPPASPAAPVMPERVALAVAGLEQAPVIPGTGSLRQAKLRCVHAACRVYEPLPVWITPARQAALRRGVEIELERACASPDAPFDAEALSRAGLIVTLAAHVSARRDLPARLSRDLRELVVQLIDQDAARPARGIPRADDALLAMLRAFEATAGPPAGAGSAITQASLVREVRPAYRMLAREQRDAAEQTIAAALANARRGSGASDPALLAAMNSHASAVADLTLLVDVSNWLAPHGTGTPPAAGPPRIADDPPRRRVALRVLKLGQVMLKQDQRESARAALRTLAPLVEASRPPAGERALRDSRGDPIAARDWDRVTGERTSELLASIDSIRAELARSWGEHSGNPTAGADSEAPAASLSLARSLTEAMRAVVRMGNTGSANPGAAASRAPADSLLLMPHWPGWELSPAAVRAMTDGAPAQLARACDAFLTRDDKRVRVLLAELERSHALVLLLDELESQARDRGVGPLVAYAELAEPPAVFDSPLARAVLGATWLANERGDLARMCWQAAEYEAAISESKQVAGSRSGDVLKQAQKIQDYVNALAKDLRGPVTAQRGTPRPGWCPQQPPEMTPRGGVAAPPK